MELGRFIANLTLDGIRMVEVLGMLSPVLRKCRIGLMNAKRNLAPLPLTAFVLSTKTN